MIVVTSDNNMYCLIKYHMKSHNIEAGSVSLQHFITCYEANVVLLFFIEQCYEYILSTFLSVRVCW